MSIFSEEIERLERIEAEAQSAAEALKKMSVQVPRDMIELRVSLVTVIKSLERVLEPVDA